VCGVFDVCVCVCVCVRSEEHTSELQSHLNLVCRLLLEKKRAHVCTPVSLQSHVTSPAFQSHTHAAQCLRLTISPCATTQHLIPHTRIFFFFLKITRPTATHTLTSHAVFRF